MQDKDPYLVYREKVDYILRGYDAKPSDIQTTYINLSEVEKATLLDDINMQVYPYNGNQFQLMNNILPFWQVPQDRPMDTPARRAILNFDWQMQYQYMQAQAQATVRVEEKPKKPSLQDRIDAAFKENQYIKGVDGKIVDSYGTNDSKEDKPIGFRESLHRAGNTVNRGFNNVAAVIKGSFGFAGDSLKSLGDLMGAPFARMRKVISDDKTSIGSKIVAGVAMALLSPFKVIGMAASITGTVVQSVGDVLGNVVSLAGAVSRAVVDPFDFSANMGNVWKQTTKVVASVGHVFTDVTKEVGTQIKQFANEAAIPGVSQVLRVAGSVAQGVAQIGESVVQGARKAMVMEFRDAGALMVSGVASAVKTFGAEPFRIVREVHEYTTYEQRVSSHVRGESAIRGEIIEKPNVPAASKTNAPEDVSVERTKNREKYNSKAAWEVSDREDQKTREEREEMRAKVKVKHSDLVASARAGVSGYKSASQDHEEKAKSYQEKHPKKDLQEHATTNTPTGVIRG